MAYYWTCKDCGANLDPGERCDCQDEVAVTSGKPIHFVKGMINTDSCICCGAYVPERRQVCISCERGENY